PRLSSGDRIDAGELQHRNTVVIPNLLDRDFPPLRPGLQDHLAQLSSASRLVAVDLGQKLAAISPRPAKPAHRDPLRILVLRRRYSKISSVNRRFSFIPAAPSNVRIDRAVRPCF